MKKRVVVFMLITVITMALLVGCSADEDHVDTPRSDAVKTVGIDIQMEDITDFYYTEENINYGAYYQRYRFYVEEGKHIFSHETRERKDDYGPCTEEDTTLAGTIELSDDQWSRLAEIVSGGTVKAREDSAESGETGPWLYLYWNGDKGKYQQFSFDSYGTQAEFEKFCLSLVQEKSGKTEPATHDDENEIDPSEETWKTPVENLPDDFIFGMDASSVLAEENSGVRYYGFDGKEQDVFKTFSEAGINYIRLRVWNDPYDEDGNGYGGGNNDLPTAIKLGKRATDYGMKVMIDFHYSDFWADPKRQHAPKAWEGMNVEEKSQALYDFTKDCLARLCDAGVEVGMVQIGNEINYGMSGERKFENVVELLKAGSRAVRETSESYGKEIDVAVHYTRIEDKAEVLTLVDRLERNGLDFDMIGMSYYPFWDGGFENMSRVLELINEKYGKKAFLAETSYCYTTADGDGSANSLSANDLVKGYPASVEGQASMIHDICKCVNEAGGMGIFYWEGAWIPVGLANADNSPVWERYGSGWASSYASDYDPEDAGLYYGGCSWENQALFDFEGHPLESLKVFGYMRHGE